MVDRPHTWRVTEDDTNHQITVWEGVIDEISIVDFIKERAKGIIDLDEKGIWRKI